MRRVLGWFGWLVGAYLVVRAAMEPFVVDFSDPDSYRTDWGGPTLAGVLAVHMLPGVIALGLMVRAWRRRPRATPDQPA